MKRKARRDRRAWDDWDLTMIARMNAKTGPWGKPHIDFHKPKDRRERTYRTCAHCFLPVVERTSEFRLRRQPCTVQVHAECAEFLTAQQRTGAWWAEPEPQRQDRDHKRVVKRRERRRPTKPGRPR